MDIDPIDLPRITQESWMDRVHYFHETDSTNNAALDHAASSPGSLAELFLAEQQTAGRGRGTNRWWSSRGSLTWSVLTPPLECSPTVLPQVSLTIGLAILETVEHFVAGDVTLKWPNDVYLNSAKVAGILIELAGNAQRLVIGVGMNVNNSVRNAPQEIRQMATSLVDASGEPGVLLDRTAVLLKCLEQLDRKIQRFTARDPQLPFEWRSRSLLQGKQVRIQRPRDVLEGTCIDIADDGALVIETTSGTEHCHGGVVAEFT